MGQNSIRLLRDLTELTLMLFWAGVPEVKSGTLAVTTQAPHPPWLQLILVPFKWAVSRMNLANDKEAEVLPELTEKSFPLIWKLMVVSRMGNSALELFFDSEEESLQHETPSLDAKCPAYPKSKLQF